MTDQNIPGIFHDAKSASRSGRASIRPTFPPLWIQRNRIRPGDQIHFYWGEDYGPITASPYEFAIPEPFQRELSLPFLFNILSRRGLDEHFKEALVLCLRALFRRGESKVVILAVGTQYDHLQEFLGKVKSSLGTELGQMISWEDLKRKDRMAYVAQTGEPSGQSVSGIVRAVRVEVHDWMDKRGLSKVTVGLYTSMMDLLGLVDEYLENEQYREEDFQTIIDKERQHDIFSALATRHLARLHCISGTGALTANLEHLFRSMENFIDEMGEVARAYSSKPRLGLQRSWEETAAERRRLINIIGDLEKNLGGLTEYYESCLSNGAPHLEAQDKALGLGLNYELKRVNLNQTLFEESLDTAPRDIQMLIGHLYRLARNIGIWPLMLDKNWRTSDRQSDGELEIVENEIKKLTTYDPTKLPQLRIWIWNCYKTHPKQTTILLENLAKESRPAQKYASELLEDIHSHRKTFA